MYTWLDITALEPEEAKISVLGIPFDGGQTQEPGAAKGPAKVREFAEKFMPGATDDWHVLDFQPLVYDFGDVDMRGTWGESFERVAPGPTGSWVTKNSTSSSEVTIR